MPHDLRAPAPARPDRPPLRATAPTVRSPLVRGLDIGAEPIARSATPVRRRHRGDRTDRVVLAALLVLVGTVLAAGLTGWPSFTDDEGTYAAQAWAVLEQGSLSHYTYWYDHPPLGWLQLAALQMLVGPFIDAGSAVGGARVLVLVPSLATVALTYLLGRRIGLRTPAAAAAALLLGLSPLAVAFLRSAYLDTLALPWVVGAFLLAAGSRGRLWSYAGSGACFAVAVLTKETMLLLLPALALQVWQTCDRRTRAFCVTAFGTVLLSIGLVYPLYAALKDELLPGPDHVSLFAALSFQLSGRASTGSPLAPDSASAGLVGEWLALDVWLPALALLLVPIALGARRLRPVGLAALLVVLVGLRPGYLPQPYITALLPFGALVVAGVADRAVGTVRRGRGLLRPVAALAVVAAVAALAAPSWAAGLRTAITTDDNAAFRATRAYLVEQIDPSSRVVVDDTFYVDLVEAGFAPQTGVIWFYKMDRTIDADPSLIEGLPGGWRDLDLVVSSPVLRGALAQQPGQLAEVRAALANSTPLVVFGTGEGRFEVRRVSPGA